MFNLLFALLTLFLTQRVVLGQNLTLREIIDANPDFSTLGLALDAAAIDPGALGTPVTLFAPTNTAFDALDSSLLELLLTPSWNIHLSFLLGMHLLESAIPAASFVNGDYTALNFETLTVSVGSDSIQISSPNTNGAVATLPEIVASDGILYELDAVLLPAFASVTLRDIAASDGFSILYELLVLTGLADVLTSDVIATVFAPDDDAFNALGADALDYYRSNIDITTTLLAGHVVTTQVVPTSEVPIEIQSEAGVPLIFQSSEGGVYTVNDVEILVANVLAINGIVHVLRGVIAVPGTEVPGTPSAPSFSPYPVYPPVESPTKDPNGMGMEKQGMESKGMMDKISKGMGGDGTSKGMGSDGTSKGMGSDGTSKGMGGDGTSKGMSSDSKSSSGMGSDGTSKGMGKSSD
jgi:uncharacterized surface protein with fasciclin (FAS1) repeats